MRGFCVLHEEWLYDMFPDNIVYPYHHTAVMISIGSVFCMLLKIASGSVAQPQLLIWGNACPSRSNCFRFINSMKVGQIIPLRSIH